MKDTTDIGLAISDSVPGKTPCDRFLASKGLRPGDYVSEGLSVVVLDHLFPNMMVGNKSEHPWQYLRREVPHNWYCDRRYPEIGFLNRDEAMLIYNLALQFKGKPGLEIGSWMGWSTCHLALAGIQLDVIDPAIGEHDNYESITGALAGAGVANNVRLIPQVSPEAVERLAELADRKWNFFFIDANHGVPAPENDARICLQNAANDVLVVFHDLVSPAVEKGLAVFRAAGFHTMVYQTMQIVGIAWRGQVRPIDHRPDPSYDWPLPDHLAKYPISGETPAVTAYRLGRQLNLAEVELATTISSLTGFQTQLDNKEREYSELSSKHMELSGEHTQLLEEQALLSAGHTQLSAEHSKLSAEHTKLSFDYTQLSADHAQLCAEHTQLSAKHEQLLERQMQSAKENSELMVALVEARGQRDAARVESDEIRTQAKRKAESLEIPLQREVNQLWRSGSWRILRPLRNIVRHRRGLGNEVEPEFQSGLEALRTVIAIRQSWSWELTAPLRLLGRIVGFGSSGFGNEQ